MTSEEYDAKMQGATEEEKVDMKAEFEQVKAERISLQGQGAGCGGRILQQGKMDY